MAEKTMKKCNNCGAEIPEDAIYCDVCGALVSKRLKKQLEKERKKNSASYTNRKKDIKEFLVLTAIVVFIFFVIATIIALIAGYIDDLRYREYCRKRDVSEWTVTVTPEEFEKLDIGMTYDE